MKFLSNLIIKTFLFAGRFLESFIAFQAIAFFFSFPFLFHRGFPISPLSFVGNFIFIPLLFMFMGISASIFFLEFFEIQTSYLIHLLELVTSAWFLLLQSIKLQPVFYVSYFKLNIFLFFCLIGFILFFFRKTSCRKIISFIFIGFLVLQIFFSQIKHLENFPQKFNFKDECIVAIGLSSGGKLILQNSIFLQKQAKKEFWVNFEFKPFLAQNFGTTDFIIQKLRFKKGKLTRK